MHTPTSVSSQGHEAQTVPAMTSVSISSINSSRGSDSSNNDRSSHVGGECGRPWGIERSPGIRYPSGVPIEPTRERHLEAGGAQALRPSVLLKQSLQQQPLRPPPQPQQHQLHQEPLSQTACGEDLCHTAHVDRGKQGARFQLSHHHRDQTDSTAGGSSSATLADVRSWLSIVAGRVPRLSKPLMGAKTTSAPSLSPGVSGFCAGTTSAAANPTAPIVEAMTVVAGRYRELTAHWQEWMLAGCPPTQGQRFTSYSHHAALASVGGDGRGGATTSLTEAGKGRLQRMLEGTAARHSGWWSRWLQAFGGPRSPSRGLSTSHTYSYTLSYSDGSHTQSPAAASSYSSSDSDDSTSEEDDSEPSAQASTDLSSDGGHYGLWSKLRRRFSLHSCCRRKKPKPSEHNSTIHVSRMTPNKRVNIVATAWERPLPSALRRSRPIVVPVPAPDSHDTSLSLDSRSIDGSSYTSIARMHRSDGTDPCCASSSSSASPPLEGTASRAPAARLADSLLALADFCSCLEGRPRVSTLTFMPATTTTVADHASQDSPYHSVESSDTLQDFSIVSRSIFHGTPHRHGMPAAAAATIDEHSSLSENAPSGKQVGQQGSRRSAAQERLLDQMRKAYMCGCQPQSKLRGQQLLQELQPRQLQQQEQHEVAKTRSLLLEATYGQADRRVRAAYDTVTGLVLKDLVQLRVGARLAEISGATSRATSEWTMRSLLTSLRNVVASHPAMRVPKRASSSSDGFRGVLRHIREGRAAPIAELSLDSADREVLARICAKSSSDEVALDFAKAPAYVAPAGAAVAYSPMTYAQLATLQPSTWLNDQVINNYLQLLCECAARDAGGVEVVASLGTHFYAKVELEMATLEATATASTATTTGRYPAGGEPGRPDGEGRGDARSDNSGVGDKVPLPPLPASHALLRWLRRRTHLLLPYSPITSATTAPTTPATTSVRIVLVPVNLFAQHWALAVWHKDTETWCFHDSLNRSANARPGGGEVVLRRLDHVLRECQRHLCPHTSDEAIALRGRKRQPQRQSRRLIALPLREPHVAAALPLAPSAVPVARMGENPSSGSKEPTTALVGAVSAAPIDTLSPFSSSVALAEAAALFRSKRLPLLAKRPREAMASGAPSAAVASAASRRVRAEGSPLLVDEPEDIGDAEVFWFTPGYHTAPQQCNGDDCGVFVCQAAWCAAQGVAVSFSAREAPMLRSVMALELWARLLLRRLPTDMMPSSMTTMVERERG